MLRVMTKSEVEESNRKLDEWWAGLGWDIKQKLENLVWTVQHPLNTKLPLTYADDPVSKPPITIADSEVGRPPEMTTSSLESPQ